MTTETPTRDGVASNVRSTTTRRHRSPGTVFARTVVYALLVLYGAVSLYPFAWMISAALKTNTGVIRDQGLVPQHPTFATLANTWSELNFFAFFGNSLIITVGTALGVLLVYSLASYALSILRFPGRTLVYRLFLLLLFVPTIVVLLPLVILEKDLGLLGSRIGLILPLVNGSAPLAILILVSAFTSVPIELREAALLDGASEFRVFWSIFLPSTRPALASVALLTAIPTWNEYVLSSVSLNDPSVFTLPLGLNQLASGSVLHYNQLMAGALIVVIPVIIAFAILQRSFVNGLTGAVKG